MKYIAIMLCSIATFGCSTHSLQRIPSPVTTGSSVWEYIETSEDNADIQLHVKAKEDTLGTYEFDFFFKKVDPFDPEVTAEENEYFRENSCISLPNGYYSFAESVFDFRAHSTYILVCWTEKSPRKNCEIIKMLKIPYYLKGSTKCGSLKYTWEWTILENPNQPVEPIAPTVD